MELHRAIADGMRTLRRTLPRALAGALSCACAAVISTPAAAQDLAPELIAATTVQAPLDTAVALRADGPVGKIVVSQPETAQVRQVGTNDLYVIGSQPGATNLLVYDRQGRLSQTLDIQVAPDAHALREMLEQALPGEPIVVKALSSSLLLEGEVSSPSVAAIAETLAQRVAPDAVISRLHARRNQVLLDVRIMEVSSRSLKEISAAIAASNGRELSVAVGGGALGPEAAQGLLQLHGGAGRLSFDATVRALEENGQLRVVAQPSLVALSGETASFRSGGEFPFPVPDDGSKVTIQFRPYGAAMTFTPTVQENGLVRVALNTELADLDPSVSIRVSGLTVPGLKVRHATTTTELRDGEAFLIAGLFEDSSQRNAREPLFLARVPVLGKVLAPVFRAVRHRSEHRELAIVVTPHIDGQAASPLGERSLLAEAEPPAPAIDPPRTPKSASAPRGPPLRAFLAEVRETLRPPTRWARQVASRFTAALLNRA